MDKIKLKLLGMSEIVGLEDVALLTLVDVNEQRQLIVTCDQQMRKELQMRMMDKPGLKQRYPEVVAGLLKAECSMQLEVLISGEKDGEYITELCDVLTGRRFQIRCSDGILFSLVYDCPVYATQDLMLHQSVPYKAGTNKVALPVNIITNEMLELSLKKAIETENYEMASNLRDELKKRQAHGGE